MAKVSAGRVLMLNKGSYDPEITYVTLDYVSHNQKMWLCRKTALGVEPVVGSEFWDLMFDIDIADNLETDNANYALSARQGKVLGDKLGNEDISELGDSVTEALNYLKEHSGSEAQKVICEDGETAQEKFDKGVYHATEGTQVDPLPRNADVLGGKYTAADIDELSSNLSKFNLKSIPIGFTDNDYFEYIGREIKIQGNVICGYVGLKIKKNLSANKGYYIDLALPSGYTGIMGIALNNTKSSGDQESYSFGASGYIASNKLRIHVENQNIPAGYTFSFTLSGVIY